jgi:CNT family concentrative nucleoside transporter
MGALSEKTVAICSVALCGFANLSSIAILIGGLGVMAPNRRSEIAELGLRAVMAGTLSNLTSAAIVGMFV